SFSISFWMKRDSTPALEENEVIIGRDSAEDGNKLHWWIGIQKTGVANAVFITRAGAPYHWNRHLRADKILTDNRWHSIVFVRNGATSENRLYVDGQLEDKVIIVYGDYDDFDSDLASMNIGWISLASKYQYKGVVDEIALYDTALPSWFVHDRYYADARYISNRTDPCD
ncbi:MAG: LamG domain-containing protein, partial [Desulfobacteraceae bacterium]